ncbi:20S proteasome subunit beta 6 [Nematocida sp. LUAm3]|nr:20S proteasome subunit beta 6 [Nematocida sp. LUAm3]KAI5176354.1 20S proteasome subunit beta 6 [Nematocida sp. LUAm2]KAI5179372.1 20S proteasome subunit beta 6 [Nematocida sp. LUAm1]
MDFSCTKNMHITQHGNGDELYDDNSGTAMAIAGEDFCIVAADTRHSAAYHINTRKSTKIFVLGSSIVLCTTGFYADARSVYDHMKYAVDEYEFKFSKIMGVDQAAGVLHMILYRYRFFPKYAYCTLSGITEEGIPKIYGYDPVGSYQQTRANCTGSGTSMLQPLLDSWISKKNWHCEEGKHVKHTEEDLTKVVRDLFSSAAETDVKTGDSIEIYVIRKEGIRREEHPLRGD